MRRKALNVPKRRAMYPKVLEGESREILYRPVGNDVRSRRIVVLAKARG